MLLTHLALLARLLKLDPHCELQVTREAFDNAREQKRSLALIDWILDTSALQSSFSKVYICSH